LHGLELDRPSTDELQKIADVDSAQPLRYNDPPVFGVTRQKVERVVAVPLFSPRAGP
jgi:hypothetical protein